MVLLLIEERDPLLGLMRAALERRGFESVHFDTADLPQRAALTLRYGDQESRGSLLHLPGGTINLSSVHAIWHRRLPHPEPVPSLSEIDRQFVVRETGHALAGLWHSLRDRFWVNPYDPTRAGEHKPYQLHVARTVGFDVPRTLMTNRADGVLDFYDSCPDGVIYKTLSNHARMIGSSQHCIYTTLIGRRDLEARIDQLQLAPCILQENVPKQAELRITVVGTRIFAAEIDSQSSDHSKIDWRRDAFRRPPAMRPVVLPSKLCQRIQTLVKQMGLVFGCIDMIRAKDDRYVFLEINPNGQWLWVERDTAMPILDSFAEMLGQGRTDFRSP